MRILSGCRKIIVLGVFACIVVFVLSLLGGKPASDVLPTLAILPSLTWTPEAVAIVATEPSTEAAAPTEVVNRRGFITYTPAPGTTYPTATITNTLTSTVTNTDLPTATSLPVSSPAPGFKLIGAETYYITRTANIRTCAKSTCEKLGQVTAGTSMTASAIFEGEAVIDGNTSWYQVFYGGTLGYIYSAYLTNIAPVRAQAPVVVPQSPVQNTTYNGPIPKNCTEARAMGIDQYTAAKINPHLDRDNDGKACYDDQ